MTDDEKKALIIVGGLAVVGVAVWLSRMASVVPPGANGVQSTIAAPAGPIYTDYNVPPYGGQAASTIYPPTYLNDNGNSCCNDGCFTAGGTNTGNAPTSLDQLLNWYAGRDPSFAKNFASTMQPFQSPPTTIPDKIGPVSANGIF